MLTEKHENLRKFCDVFYHEGYCKAKSHLINLLDDFYVNPLHEAESFVNKLLDDSYDNSLKDSVFYSSAFQRLNKTLNYVKDRQETNSIWQVVEMDE